MFILPFVARWDKHISKSSAKLLQEFSKDTWEAERDRSLQPALSRRCLTNGGTRSLLTSFLNRLICRQEATHPAGPCLFVSISSQPFGASGDAEAHPWQEGPLQILGLSLCPSHYLSVPTTICPTDPMSVSSPDSPYFSATESLSASPSVFASPSLYFSTSTSPCLCLSTSIFLTLSLCVSFFSVSLSLFLSVFLTCVVFQPKRFIHHQSFCKYI